MEQALRIHGALFVLAAALSMVVSCKSESSPSERSTSPVTLSAIAQDVPFIISERSYPAPVSGEIVAILKSKKEKG